MVLKQSILPAEFTARMTQLPLFQPASWTVTELTRYLRALLENDPNLQQIWVLGEVSNLSRPSSGHLYFTLKDAGAALRCVMWRNAVARQPFLPREGDAVEVHGSLGVYEANGTYQLYADWLRPAGEGALYQEFLRLKARLEAEGLFDEARKRPIPRWPTTIGIVTSPTGAALQDMCNTLRRRFPIARVILAGTPVQGSEAPASIIDALQRLNTCVPQVDIILLARGGGSIEDLWAFNDEGVARAIVASRAPVICGVGHETDFTIADFAADLRAPTPTAAAELCTPDKFDLQNTVNGHRRQMERLLFLFLEERNDELAALENRLRLQTPITQVRRDRQRLDELFHRAQIGLGHILNLRRAHLAGLEQQLSALNPNAILNRGFAAVTGSDGRLVRSVHQVAPGDDLSVRVSDGRFGVRVATIPEPGGTENR